MVGRGSMPTDMPEGSSGASEAGPHACVTATWWGSVGGLHGGLHGGPMAVTHVQQRQAHAGGAKPARVGERGGRQRAEAVTHQQRHVL